MISKSSIEVAEILLIKILNDKRTEEIDGHVDMFDNCREQGYRLVIYPKNSKNKVKTIAFSENRNSDEIVVYSSNVFESGLPYSKEFWGNAKYFKYEDYEGAKDYIISSIILNQ